MNALEAILNTPPSNDKKLILPKKKPIISPQKTNSLQQAIQYNNSKQQQQSLNNHSHNNQNYISPKKSVQDNSKKRKPIQISDNQNSGDADLNEILTEQEQKQKISDTVQYSLNSFTIPKKKDNKRPIYQHRQQYQFNNHHYNNNQNQHNRNYNNNRNQQYQQQQFYQDDDNNEQWDQQNYNQNNNNNYQLSNPFGGNNQSNNNIKQKKQSTFQDPFQIASTSKNNMNIHQQIQQDQDKLQYNYKKTEKEINDTKREWGQQQMADIEEEVIVMEEKSSSKKYNNKNLDNKEEEENNNNNEDDLFQENNGDNLLLQGQEEEDVQIVETRQQSKKRKLKQLQMKQQHRDPKLQKNIKLEYVQKTKAKEDNDDEEQRMFLESLKNNKDSNRDNKDKKKEKLSSLEMEKKRGIDSIKNVGDSFQQQLKQQLDLQKEKMHSSVQNDRDQALLKKDPSQIKLIDVYRNPKKYFEKARNCFITYFSEPGQLIRQYTQNIKIKNEHARIKLTNDPHYQSIPVFKSNINKNAQISVVSIPKIIADPKEMHTNDPNYLLKLQQNYKVAQRRKKQKQSKLI